MANRAARLFHLAAESPDRTALLFEGATHSFARLAQGVQAMAGGLAALGIGHGDHVGLLLRASPDFILVQQALFALGAVVTPINILYRAGEIRHAVACCALDHIVTARDLADALDADMGCPLILLDAPADGANSRSLPFAIDHATPLSAPVPLQPDDMAMLLLTSATTGKAKGVMLSAGNLAANYDSTPRWLGLDDDSVILCALPLYNTFGLNQCINAMLMTGCTLVLHARFDAGACIGAIAAHRCTFLPAVPTMLQKILDHPSANRDSLGSLRTIMTGGAPVPSALLQRLLAVAPDVRLLTGYGLTEATALVTLTQVRLGDHGGMERERTIGRVLDGMDLAIVDDTGAPCPVGVSGEIIVRGPNIMAGYYLAPLDSAMALRDGWLRTGDIGHLDADGYAYIVDRKKDVIIRGGQNIYPADIEEILYQIPGVAEAAVIAREDTMLGEVPVAFVALQPGRRPTPDQILAHCRTHLAAYKVPAAITLLDELPKGPTGKILRRALRAQPVAG
ncbi:MAG: long-chain fatty acid--CoA ligase [Sphingobium sp.]|nr:long-chain fatty acid--CoA ligase [Sphingobium sp.]